MSYRNVPLDRYKIHLRYRLITVPSLIAEVYQKNNITKTLRDYYRKINPYMLAKVPLIILVR